MSNGVCGKEMRLSRFDSNFFGQYSSYICILDVYEWHGVGFIEKSKGNFSIHYVTWTVCVWRIQIIGQHVTWYVAEIWIISLEIHVYRWDLLFRTRLIIYMGCWTKFTQDEWISLFFRQNVLIRIRIEAEMIFIVGPHEVIVRDSSAKKYLHQIRHIEENVIVSFYDEFVCKGEMRMKFSLICTYTFQHTDPLQPILTKISFWE